MFNRDMFDIYEMFNISFKKDTEKVVLLQVKDLIQIIGKFRAGIILWTFLLCTKHWETQNIMQENNFVATL